MSIDEKLQKLGEDFAIFPGKDERNNYLFDLGKRLKINDLSIRTPENEIKGCQFKSWLRSSFEDGVMSFSADSEALLGRGMMFICLELFDRQPPEMILKFDPTTILPRLGLDQHISSTRSNAFVLVPQQMKQRALEFSAA
jgi:cysteine desulfuration protein SufE